MELHHDKHHATYVNSYNTQMEKMQEAQSKGDVQAQIAIQPLINFHGGMSGIRHTVELQNKVNRTNDEKAAT